MDRDNFIAIGKIAKQIGIKGNLKIISLTDFPERFNKLKEVFLFDEKKNLFLMNSFTGSYVFVISEFKLCNNYINLKFENYNNIDDAMTLVNSVLMIEEKDKIELEKNNFYYYQLIGKQVFDKGIMIGNVFAINNFGSDDLLIVKSEVKEILIPFRKEFIRNIDIENNRIDVDLIEGF